MKTEFSHKNLLINHDLISNVVTPRKLEKSPLIDSITDQAINKKMLEYPKSTEPEKLCLYFEGEKGSFLGEGADYPNYFIERGYDVLENPSPSLLVDVADQLKRIEDKLWKLNVPSDTNIILISTPPLFTDFGLECFLNARWTPDGYILRLISADSIDFSDSAFIVKKKE